jgi:hypothetical protein
VEIQLKEGTAGGASWIYALWVENEADGFFKNIFISKRVNKQDLTGTALPFWQFNKRTKTNEKEVDAVTGATKAAGDLTFTVPLKDLPERFTIYLEIDHSFDRNDWFKDQPAILYSIEVDTSGEKTQFPSDFIGWTPNENTENTISNTPAGTLQNETGYITRTMRSDSSFGAVDDANTSTRLVGSLTATVFYE